MLDELRKYDPNIKATMYELYLAGKDLDLGFSGIYKKVIKYPQNSELPVGKFATDYISYPPALNWVAKHQFLAEKLWYELDTAYRDAKLRGVQF